MRENNIRAQPGYRTRRYVAGKPVKLIPDLVKRNFEVSFFGSRKKERIKKRIYRNRDVATADVSDYIESFFVILNDDISTLGVSVLRYLKLQ